MTTATLPALDVNTPQKVWNGGAPVWNKGTAMKPPFACVCACCQMAMEIPYGLRLNRARIWRIKRGDPAYCSERCRSQAKNAKISAALMGHSAHLVTPDGAARRSAALRGRTPWNKGIPNTEAHRAKISNALRNSPVFRRELARIHATFKGENSPHWKGGVTPEHRMMRASVQAKAWRFAVFERDDYTCQLCGTRGGELAADHIKAFATHKELRCEISNGRTLCQACHRKTPTYGRPRKVVW